MIQEYIEEATYLKEELLPAYNTAKGRRIYEDTLNLVNEKLPQYVRELQGVADGSQVPFHEVVTPEIRERDCSFVLKFY